MSYGQKFTGSYTYADAHCMEAGIDAFLEDREDVLLDLSDLLMKPNLVAIDYDCSAPASMYEPTEVALERLGSFAYDGGIDTEFHLDGVSREYIGHGGCTSSEGLPPRHRKWEVYAAAQAGDAAVLTALREAGVDLAQELADTTALELAAATGSADAVRTILAAGAKATPGALVRSANAATAAALFDAGARLDDKRLFSVVCDRDDVATLLFDRGAPILAGDFEAIANRLARAGNVTLLHRILEREPGFAAALTTEHVMRNAIRGNEPVLIDFLLDHGTTLPDDYLHQAVEANATTLVENVLKLPGGVASCGPSSTREDAMCVAASNGAIAVMELLASYGVPIQPATAGSTSPLIAAASAYDRKAIDAVRWLLDRGVSVTSVDAEGQSVLQRASFAEVSALLVKRGADRAQLAWDDMAEEDAETLHRLLGD